MRLVCTLLALGLALSGAVAAAQGLPAHAPLPANPPPAQPLAAAAAICSGHGRLVGTFCTCLPGWSGASCQAPAPLACNGHGELVQGRCICSTYWMGPSCEVAGLSITGRVVQP